MTISMKVIIIDLVSAMFIGYGCLTAHAFELHIDGSYTDCQDDDDPQERNKVSQRYSTIKTH
jgi:hypothetical protein